MPILPVDKPLGLTSHDVVARARRQLRTRRVGHAGTLDPLATGVLVLLSDEATKLSPFLSANRKHYLAWVAFGAGTPTLDAEGPVTARATATELKSVTAQRIAAAGAGFLALTEQKPPAYSAVKQAGERSYQAARRGEVVEPPPRQCAYQTVELCGFAAKRELLPQRFAPEPDDATANTTGNTAVGARAWRTAESGRAFELPPTLLDAPTALFRLEVGAGTYVRSFARDLGAALGVPAHLAGLVRTGAGNIDLSDCVPLSDLDAAKALNTEAALPYPALHLSSEEAELVRQGRPPPLPVRGVTALFDEAGELAAMVEPREAGSVEPSAGGAPGAAAGPARPSVAPVHVRTLRAWQRGLTP